MGSRRTAPPWLSPLEPGRRRGRPRGHAGVVTVCVLAASGLVAAALIGALSPAISAAAVASLLVAGGGALTRLG
jgi:hypothetical protein